jgi:hypothetical protein
MTSVAESLFSVTRIALNNTTSVTLIWAGFHLRSARRNE